MVREWALQARLTFFFFIYSVGGGRRNKLRAMALEAMWSDGYGGEALYCVIVLWLSIISWIIFTSIDDTETSRKRRRRQGKPVFIGATGFCDGTCTGCDGGYGVCDTCVS